MGRLHFAASLAVAALFWGSASAQEVSGPTKQPPAANPKLRLDLYGDPLPAGALVRMGTLQFRQAITTASPLVFSADGKHLFSASSGDQTLRIFDVATGKQVQAHKFPASTDRYWPGLALTPNGQTAAVDPTSGVYFRKGDHEKEWAKIPVDGLRWQSNVALSCDGRLLALGSYTDSTIRLLEPIKAKELPVTFKCPGGVYELLLSSDGRLLAAVGPNSVLVWDIPTGKELHTFPTRLHIRATTAAFSCDGKFLAVRSPRQPGQAPGRAVSIVLWDIDTGKKVREFPFVDYYSVLFSPDGQYLAATGSELICVWEVATGREYRKLPHFGSSPTFSPDGRTLAYRFGATICLWDLATDKQFAHRAGHMTDPQLVTFSPNGKLLASADYRNAILWDAATGKQLHCLEGHAKAIDCLAFTIDGKTLVSASMADRTMRRWDVTTSKEVSRLTFEEDAKKPIQPGKRKKTDEQAPWLASTVRLSHDCRTLILVRQGPKNQDERAIQGWDVDSGKELFVRQSTDQVLVPELLTRDGKQSNAAALRSILVQNQRGFTLSTWPPVVSPDGKIIAVAHWKYQETPSGASSEIEGYILWELATGQQLMRIPTGHAYLAAFSAESRMFLSVGADALQVWDVATGKRVFRQSAHETFQGNRGTTFASCLAFAPNGRSLATGLLDSTILVWDLSPERWHAQLAAPSLGLGEFDSLWSDLGDADARKAHAALWTLAAAKPSAVDYVDKRLLPTVAVDPGTIKQSIADLANERFADRDAAMRKLRAAGEQAAPMLRAALQASPSLELRRRLETLLDALLAPPAPGEPLRRWRAIQMLEGVNTKAARGVLQKLAGGPAWARETQEAQAALQRLVRRAIAAE